MVGDAKDMQMSKALAFMHQHPDADIVIVLNDHSTDSGCVLYDEVLQHGALVSYAAPISEVVKRYLGSFWESILVDYHSPKSRRILVSFACGSAVVRPKAMLDLQHLVESLSSFLAL